MFDNRFISIIRICLSYAQTAIKYISSVAVRVDWSEYSPLTSIAHLSMLIWSESLVIPNPPTSLLNV